MSSKVSLVAKFIFTRWVALAVVVAASSYLIYRGISHYLGNNAAPVAPAIPELPADDVPEPVAPPVDEPVLPADPDPVAPAAEEPVPPVDPEPVAPPVDEPVPPVDPEPVAAPTHDAPGALEPYYPYVRPVALGSLAAASTGFLGYCFQNGGIPEDVGPIGRMAALGTLAAASVGLLYYAGSYCFQNRAPAALPIVPVEEAPEPDALLLVAVEDPAVGAPPEPDALPIVAVEAAPGPDALPLAVVEGPAVEAAPEPLVPHPADGAVAVAVAALPRRRAHRPPPEGGLMADLLAGGASIEQIFEIFGLIEVFSAEQIALRDFLLPVLGEAAQAFVRFMPPGTRIVRQGEQFRITFNRARNARIPELEGCTISVPRGDLIVCINGNQLTFRGALFTVSHPVDDLEVPAYLRPFLYALGDPIVAEVHGVERVGETLRPTIYMRSVRRLVPNVSITRFLPYLPFQNVGRLWLFVRWLP